MGYGPDRQVDTMVTHTASRWRFALAVVACLVALSLPSVAHGAGYGHRTVRGSGTTLWPSNGPSSWGVLSADARSLVFQSDATNLAPGGGAGSDIFVRDMRSASIRCVSTSGDGAVPDGTSASPSVTGDGRIVAFASNSSNLAAADTNHSWDVFCRSIAASSPVAVSVTPAGVVGNDDSSSPVISANGRFVAFVSAASDLVVGDSGSYNDVFVRDLTAGVTTRISVGIGGVEANGASSAPSISADGRKVAFVSLASNLVPGDTNRTADVFVVDVPTLAITRASVGGSNTQANLASRAPAISGSGSRVAFESLATNLVRKDSNEVRDIFVRDLLARTTLRASVSSRGGQGNADSREPSLSHSGLRVAFSSSATNLVSGDTNGRADVFVRNISGRTTTRVSRPYRGQAKGSSAGVSITADGSRVAYQSTAANLVSSDTNRRPDVFVSSWGRRTLQRVSGDSVYATAASASKSASPYGAGAVVIVNGSDWRSALAASGLAGTVRGSLLYAGADSLPAVTREEIVRLGAKRAYVVGGTSAVSSAVASELASIVGTSAVERIGSGDGYAVSEAVAKRVVAIKGASWNGSVLAVSGASPTAAIAGVPLAAASGRPVVFVNPSTGRYRLPSGTRSATIVGSTGSVPRSAESRLRRTLGSSRVVRYTGTNRYAAASVVAARSVSRGHSWDGLTVVNPAKPTEAISGAVMAGRSGSVVLYAKRDALPRDTRDRLSAVRSRTDSARVVGTTSSVSASVFSAIRKALGG